MNLTGKTHDNILVVTVHDARIDASVALQFKELMREQTRATTGRVILDMSRVDFVDSSGLGAIVAAMKQLENTQTLELSGLQGAVERVFDLTHMNTIFTIHDELTDAVP